MLLILVSTKKSHEDMIKNMIIGEDKEHKKEKDWIEITEAIATVAIMIIGGIKAWKRM